MPLAGWPVFLARQGVDLAHSRVAMTGGAITAFALAAPRADHPAWRLGTMGALPQARGSGAAAALLDDFIERARGAGCQRVELECFAQNERGLRLYRSRGFEPVYALHGYRRPATDGIAATHAPDVGLAVQAVALEEAFDWLTRYSRAGGDLPLQVTPPSLRALPVQLAAWRAGDAQLVAAESAPGQWTIYSLVDTQADQAGAQALAEHLIRTQPGATLLVPQLQRDNLGGQALQRLGFERLPLHQLWMRKGLNAPGTAPT